MFDPEGATAEDEYIDPAQISVDELNVVVDESMMPGIRAEVEEVVAGLETQATDLNTLEPFSKTEAGGLPGFQVTYSFSKGGVPVTSKLCFLFRGCIEYQLTLQAATENWEATTSALQAW